MNYLPYLKFSAPKHMSTLQLMSCFLSQVWNQINLLKGERLQFSLTTLPKTWYTNNEPAEAADEMNLSWTQRVEKSKQNEKRRGRRKMHRLRLLLLHCFGASYDLWLLQIVFCKNHMWIYHIHNVVDCITNCKYQNPKHILHGITAATLYFNSYQLWNMVLVVTTA